ncbi:MAG: protein kinase [Deltaproteobacteria bacterium]|nr:protein kinase [Deltaproteobacteria bacterium]
MADDPVPDIEANDPLAGTLVAGKYRVRRVIGRGGMARVYLASQEPLGRPVALKVLTPHPHPDVPAGVQEKRFFREAAVSSRLVHPNTVVIHDYGRAGDGEQFYIAMEYLEGRTLREAIIADGPFPWRRMVHVAQQACGALAEAHAAGVVHRDLKPTNIMLVRRGDDRDFVKVLDFGLVKAVGEGARDRDTGESLTIDGTFVGSPGYLPPEQILGEAMDQRGDIYSVGVLLFEMLTGRTPFRYAADGPRHLAVVVAQLESDPIPLREALPSLSAPAMLQDAVMRCMRRMPADRFQTIGALVEALKEAASGAGRLGTGSARPAPAATAGDDGARDAPTRLDVPAATDTGSLRDAPLLTPATNVATPRGQVAATPRGQVAAASRGQVAATPRGQVAAASRGQVVAASRRVAPSSRLAPPAKGGGLRWAAAAAAGIGAGLILGLAWLLLWRDAPSPAAPIPVPAAAPVPVPAAAPAAVVTPPPVVETAPATPMAAPVAPVPKPSAAPRAPKPAPRPPKSDIKMER